MVAHQDHISEEKPKRKPVVGRFAPSPTGPLHIGSLVAAVGSYLMAKRMGGQWLLRMEDLDTPRVLPGMADDILRTLEILSLHWDGDIVWQSRRSEAYEMALKKLVEEAHAYCCGCSRAEIARISSAPHGRDGEILYPGTCGAGLAEGKEPRAWRVRVADEEISFIDELMGDISENLRLSCGDFVVKRADGPFAYQLAVVVDDAATGVNQVVRGADLLSSTPRQIYLQRLLSVPTPSYTHLPLVTGADGGKLSKRDNAVSLSSGSDLGAEGGRLVTQALRFLGQIVPASLQGASPCELLSWGIEAFNQDLIPRISSSMK